MVIKNNKGQTFSADLLVVMVIFLFGVIYLVVNQINQEEKVDFEGLSDQATREARIIVDELKTREVVSQNNEVDIERLLQLDKVQLQEELGIEGDFAIVFERDGKLVRIDPHSNVNCIGSNKVIVNGVPCRS